MLPKMLSYRFLNNSCEFILHTLTKIEKTVNLYWKDNDDIRDQVFSDFAFQVLGPLADHKQ